ncbi:MAG: cysteine--tRNA ligase [Clostridia bacterium]|nr:cysteine--tRNA ligase [Clostridia bacterium]
MKIYNSLTGKKEEFVPLHEGKVNMYACGITVYDACHIGHALQAIVYDVISRYLRYKGYDVTYVRNYTDVDDKIIARANAEGINAIEYSKMKIAEAEEDLHAIGVRDADKKPRATEYIGKIIAFIEGLIKNGHAYPTENGDVFYDVLSFKEYGKLSNKSVEDLRKGVRKEIAPGKRNDLDFALWKSAKEGEISWESPWGHGRPGWHIECSAMSIDTLGETLDIHGGGRDLIFPHHENEIAQSEALTGKTFARYWIHNGLITVNGQKMSKSLGNSMTIREALKLYNSDVIRYVMLSNHYSSNLDINNNTFVIAEKHMYYFYSSLLNMDAFAEGADGSDAPADEIIDNIEANFVNCMDDNFNTSAVLAELFPIFKYGNSLLKCKKNVREENSKKIAKLTEAVRRHGEVLGLFEQNPADFVNAMKQKHISTVGITEEEIQSAIASRAAAKAEKNYADADAIRSSLAEKGIIIMDSSQGTTWDIEFKTAAE